MLPPLLLLATDASTVVGIGAVWTAAAGLTTLAGRQILAMWRQRSKDRADRAKRMDEADLAAKERYRKAVEDYAQRLNERSDAYVKEMRAVYEARQTEALRVQEVAHALADTAEGNAADRAAMVAATTELRAATEATYVRASAPPTRRDR